MISKFKNIPLLLSIIIFTSCGRKINNTAESAANARTPVTVTSVSKGELTQTIEINATSSFLLKTPVKSVANGYLQNVKIRQGDFVSKGEVLMSVVTKESKSIGNEINKLD